MQLIEDIWLIDVRVYLFVQHPELRRAEERPLEESGEIVLAPEEGAKRVIIDFGDETLRSDN